MLEIVKDKEPFVVEALNDVLEYARGSDIQALGMVYLINDKVYTEVVKNDGTSALELIGAIEILRQEILEMMKR